jgi:hypothetical protein
MNHFHLNDIDVEDFKLIKKEKRNLNVLEIDFDSNIFP